MHDTTTTKEKLLSLGAEEGELDAIITEVQDIITEDILTKYIETTDEATQKAVAALSGPELITYFAEHKNTLPPLSEETCQAITEETWADYFRFMQENSKP